MLRRWFTSVYVGFFSPISRKQTRLIFLGGDNGSKLVTILLLSDRGASSKQRYLFCLTAHCPGIKSFGGRAFQLEKHPILGVNGVLATIRENERQYFHFSRRTDNRIRSPR